MKIFKNNKAFYSLFFQNLKMSLLFLILIFCTNFMYSQTLEFSQVKLVSAEETVPSGKVWKIENILPTTRLTSTAGTGSSIATATTTQSFKVDGTIIYYATSDSRGTKYGNETGFTSSAFSLSGPIWLPEGTKLEVATGIYALSVIEFTVVP